ncbi:glutathione peroxidase [Kordiimonas sediminis]|uniref:Glutathione peroxidase n=1 Tax=Kordiimonas sediminis TaxID=1735581 RepID=A0A919AY80_9PROT|nr:glutathione peroxidase [Kordiimonas sediminis]GHF30931.1 glutathione peroxidase [Kordiimonas sediminis]
MTSIFDFSCKTLQGKDKALSDYKGHVVLIVNTASKCGFTPQFAGLENLYKDLQEKGLVILGFPCNQFGSQDPGSNEEIGEFCQLNYGVSFPMMAKVDVNGDDADPIFKHLKAEKPGILGSKRIKWNFTKFLCDREGNVVKRFAPSDRPEQIRQAIMDLL